MVGYDHKIRLGFDVFKHSFASIRCIDRKEVAMGSENFRFLARVPRRRRFEKPCNGAETKPEIQKTAVRQDSSGLLAQHHSFDENTLLARWWVNHNNERTTNQKIENIKNLFMPPYLVASSRRAINCL